MSETNPPHEASAGQHSPADQALLRRFESLGGTGHGDEFGLFQQSMGVDQDGLFRSADLGHDLLIKALENRLSGIGLPENTIIFQPEHSREWWTKDSRYWMAMRSFVNAAEVNAEQAVEPVCNRLAALREKLIGDLSAGNRLFVFRNIFRDLTDAEIARLHAAVRSYGDGTLLYVRYADAAHPAGSVETRAPGLLIGYLSHFAFSADNKPLGHVHAAWLALCRRAWDVHTRDAAPVEPAAVRRAISQGPRRIVLVGNCQVDAMAGLYRRFVARRTGDTLEVIPSYQDLTPERRNVIAQADLVVLQVLDVKPQADADAMNGAAPRLFIPAVTAAFLWPFAGQEHPANTRLPFLPSGPYGGEAGDSYLNRMIAAGTGADEAVETYLNLDVRGRVNLDRLYELVMDRQRSRDGATGYQMADIIERHFRDEQIFLSPYHPNVRVAVALAEQFFRQLGATGDDIALMRERTRVTPFPKDELPIHPAVARHFGLNFVTTDRRYRFMNEGTFTFREFALRYMRCEWNPALEEGLALLRQGQSDAALERLTVAVAQSPGSAAGHNGMAHLYVKQSLRDQALKSARRAVEIEPDNAPYQTMFGTLLRDAGRLEMAEQAFRAAAAADPTEPHFLLQLALLLRRRGSDAEAATLLREAIRLDPYDAGPRAQLAELLEAGGALAEAAEALVAATEREPDNAGWFHRLGQILARVLRFDQAEAAVRRAAALDGDRTRLHMTLSDFWLRRDRPDNALEEARAATAAGPANARAFANLGQILRRSGDRDSATAAFQQAVALNPADAHIRHEYSVLLCQQEAVLAAIDQARHAADLEPANPHRLAHLAGMLARHVDLAAAEAAQRKAISLQPDHVPFRVSLTELLTRQGRVAEAMAEARAFVQVYPNSASALGHVMQPVQAPADSKTPSSSRGGRAVPTNRPATAEI